VTQLSAELDKPYDYIVVGGGAHGCAIAYHLAGKGVSVAVIDAGRVACGASGGFGKRGVRGNRRAAVELELMRQAYELWPALADELDGETGYKRTGGVILIEEGGAQASSAVAAAPIHADVQNKLGVPTEVWASTKVRDRLPNVAETVTHAIYAPLDGVASHEATTMTYAQAAQRRGVTIVDGQEVTSLTVDRFGRATAAVLDDGAQAVYARRGIVVTTNLTSRRIIEKSTGFTLPIWQTFPQAALLRSANTPDIPYLTGHASRTLSVKTLDDGIIMLSGGWRGRWNTRTGAGEVIPTNLEGNIRELTATFPHLGALSVLAADASRAESNSPDQSPFIDVVPGTENVVVAAGWSGHGWALVPSVSKNVAEWLMSGHKPRALEPFTIARMSKAEVRRAAEV